MRLRRPRHRYLAIARRVTVRRDRTEITRVGEWGLPAGAHGDPEFAGRGQQIAARSDRVHDL